MKANFKQAVRGALLGGVVLLTGTGVMGCGKKEDVPSLLEGTILEDTYVITDSNDNTFVVRSTEEYYGIDVRQVAEQQDRRHHKRDTDHEHRLEKTFDIGLEEHAYDEYRYHGDTYLQDIVGLIVVSESEKPLQETPYLLSEDHDCAEHGGRMDGHFKYKVPRASDAEKFPAYDQMPAAADRQELGQSLDKTENYCLVPLHEHPLLLEDFHYGHYLHDNPGYYDKRCGHKTPEVEHGIVEDLRVIAAASCHEDISGDHDNQACQHYPHTLGRNGHPFTDLVVRDILSDIFL